jgi:hypothetical protein
VGDKLNRMCEEFMINIVVRNPDISLQIGSRYSLNEELLICKKLFVVASILDELKHSRGTVRKLKNHPIHEFTIYLWEVVAIKMIRVGELELFVKDIEELAIDFSRSKNLYIKERTSTALRVMNEIIYGDYSIDSGTFKEHTSSL